MQGCNATRIMSRITRIILLIILVILLIILVILVIVLVAYHPCVHGGNLTEHKYARH